MSRIKPFGKRTVGILYGKKKARKSFFGSDHNFIGVRFFLPNLVFKMLQAFRATKGIPIARLVAIAVFNEIYRPNAFYLKQVADTPYEPGKYGNEAALIYRFLNDNKGGMAKDLLIMSRVHIGIVSEDGFLHGLTELLETGLIQEVQHVEGSDMPWVQIKNFSQETSDYAVRRTLSNESK